MVCILCQQQLLHLSTVLLMKWLAFTFGTSVWQIGGICCLIMWTFLINEAGLSSCGACPGKRTHLVHTQSWARLKNLKACQHGLALLPRCPCSSLGQDLSSLFTEQLWLAMSEFPAVSWVYRHVNHVCLLQSLDHGGPIWDLVDQGELGLCAHLGTGLCGHCGGTRKKHGQ